MDAARTIFGAMDRADIHAYVAANVAVRPSRIAGLGAFYEGSVPIPPLTYIGLYQGVVRHNHGEAHHTDYCLALDDGMVSCVDASDPRDGNWTRFMNDAGKDHNVVFTGKTTCRVQAVDWVHPGDELTTTYGAWYWSAKDPSVYLS